MEAQAKPPAASAAAHAAAAISSAAAPPPVDTVRGAAWPDEVGDAAICAKMGSTLEELPLTGVLAAEEICGTATQGGPFK